MGNPPWKKQERRVAKLFGTRRTPLSGGNSGHNTQSDTLSPDFYVECKYRQTMPVVKWAVDTCAKANEEKKIPLFSLKSKDSSYDFFVIRRDHLMTVVKKMAMTKGLAAYNAMGVCRNCRRDVEQVMLDFNGNCESCKGDDDENEGNSNREEKGNDRAGSQDQGNAGPHIQPGSGSPQLQESSG